ncbi:MAG TPA: SUMF1/EgtB/PvdO family nonheme iron enzyme [Clostridiales bacterium]|nr:SUMF1/EgtB/PvdO family nonheme iron enzyme [Clostridiales bacterium]HQP68769.1 SUMF1/EgtB/PvdO family nonheme iron enzyme [Clostridiales bacterium]
MSIKSKEGNNGKRWAICVGINNYDYNGILDLDKARNDAVELGSVLKNYGQFDYVFTMTDQDPRSVDYPSVGKFRSKLKYLEQYLEPEDLVVFSFSGHGVSDNTGDGYLLMTDSDPDNLFKTSVKIKEITSVIERSKVKKSLLLIDACREILTENRGLNNEGLKAEKFESSEVAATFYATRAGGFSYEDEMSGFGAFTNYLLKGMKGEADKPSFQGNGDGIITFTELASFVEEGVINWAIEKGKIQKPYTRIYGEKFGDLALTTYKPNSKNIDISSKNKIENTNESQSRINMKIKSNSGIGLVLVRGGDINLKGKKFHLNDYYIGETEVTQLQWKEVMKNNPSFFKGDSLPVEEVTWFDAMEFCNRLSIKEGLKVYYKQVGQKITTDKESDGYRLPDELEWEYAASECNVETKNQYSGGDDIEILANYIGNSNRSTTPAASKKANGLGIYDMSGNVREWCWDWYFPNLTLIESIQNQKSGSYRLVKGGGWMDYADNCRISSRNGLYPSDSNSSTGLRIARSIK